MSATEDVAGDVYRAACRLLDVAVRGSDDDLRLARAQYVAAVEVAGVVASVAPPAARRREWASERAGRLIAQAAAK